MPLVHVDAFGVLSVRFDRCRCDVAETAIQNCKAKLPPPPPPPPPKPEPPPPPEPVKHEPAKGPATWHWYSDKLTDTVLVAGTVSGVVALLAYRAARGDLDVADQATTFVDHDLHVHNAMTMRSYALVAGGAAAVLVSYGVWRATRGHHAERAVAAVPLPGGAMFAITGPL